MSDPGALPRFVREAMHRDEWVGDPPSRPPVERSAAEQGESSALAERSLLALEDALSDAVEVEAVHVRLPESMLTEAPARLARFVLEPPQRYAPFFARVAQLLDVTEDSVIAELTRLREPSNWRAAGQPGVSRLPLRGGPALKLAKSNLVRLSPSVTLLRPRGLGAERALVLEGSYTDERGNTHRPGDLAEWSRDTAHSFTARDGEPCIIASVILGSSLRSRLERAIAALVNR